MEMKKFNSIAQFLISKEFRNKNLSYCDLSGIDLSHLPSFTWNGFIFDHTNFSDTGIKFYPNKLSPLCKEYHNEPYYSIEYCDFTNCDLSYLTTDDMSFVSIKGVNFTNTNLNIELTNSFGRNIEESWQGLGFKDFSDIIFPQDGKMNETIMKIVFLTNHYTIKNNPLVPFSSIDIYHAICKYLPDEGVYISTKKIEELNNFIDEMLEEDVSRDGNLVKLFDTLNTSNPFNAIERIRFFQKLVNHKSFSVVDLSDIPCELIKEVSFNNCMFEKIIFPDNFESKAGRLSFYRSSIKCVVFPTLTSSSWRDFSDTRFGHSRITFSRNLYLELGRNCNGSCKFCRNQYLQPCNYDFEAITDNLGRILNYINNIVIGGGEPTLFLDDIYTLKRKNNQIGKSWTVFTNASSDLGKLVDLSDSGFALNISRHAVSDQVNDEILGVKSLSVSELKELKKRTYTRLTLCATCFKGDGIDTVEEMEDYIALSDECNISNILFQTLHEDLENLEQLDSVLPIDDSIFDEMLFKLQEQGYEISMPIYSTGDYKLIIAKNDRKTISFKRYISKEELEREWHMACKRTFDLSMDPSGNVYENWHQSSGKIYLKK